MKNYFLLFLFAINHLLVADNISKSEEALVLTGLQKFKVVTLLPFYEKTDRNVIFDSLSLTPDGHF